MSLQYRRLAYGRHGSRIHHYLDGVWHLGCHRQTRSPISLDNPGIVSDIANFFASQDINIEAMETNTYAAPHTGSPMFALAMTVNIPGQIHIALLRENFMVFCDDRNLDAIIEPYKP